MNTGQKKTMSQKQIEANRSNGRKSAGPKTSEGKAISSLNAMKHGILSDEVVVRALRHKESVRAFRAFRERFWQALAPVGSLEEALVEQIVANRWRARRVLIAETGEISFSVDHGWWSRNDSNLAATWVAWIHSLDMICAMEKSADGVHYLMHVLEQLRDDVKNEGQLTEDALKRTITLFAGKTNSVTNRLAEFCSMTKDNPERHDAAALATKQRQLVLDYIEDKLRSLLRRLRRLEEYEQKAEQARQAVSVLPSADKLDKILRYETTLDRQFHRAMHQLERLQRMRNGEHVPAPMAMTV